MVAVPVRIENIETPETLESLLSALAPESVNAYALSSEQAADQVDWIAAHVNEPHVMRAIYRLLHLSEGTRQYVSTHIADLYWGK